MNLKEIPFESYLLKAIRSIILLGCGFGIGIFYMNDRFEEGGKFMQHAYTNGYVVREVIRR